MWTCRQVLASRSEVRAEHGAVSVSAMVLEATAEAIEPSRPDPPPC